jgi:uncharacterized protein YndB with AHSA1/START domain
VVEVRIEDAAVIDAPIGEVWGAIADPARHAQWHPFVTRISGQHRLGAVRSCSVVAGKKTGETRERCIEEDAERRISWAIEEDSTGFSRMVSDWRAGFTLEPVDGGTRAVAESVFRPKSVLLRLMGPIVKRKFHRAQRAILAGLKDAAESDGPR